MDELIKLLASLVAVALIALLVRWLGMGQAKLESDADAIVYAEAAQVGFIGGDVLRDAGGNAAIVAAASGQGFVLLKKLGSKFAGRFVAVPNYRVDNHQLIVSTDDALFGDVAIDPDTGSAMDRMLKRITRWS
jgi:hypothetical protein